ncbi:hypothetical protein Sjap_026328 [Stephania japonica]|uniref:Uncharacterized protein n=1 Tax=Stephania japonica TaxID=461633 RepID=A0AAP0HIE5_9MAGN
MKAGSALNRAGSAEPPLKRNIKKKMEKKIQKNRKNYGKIQKNPEKYEKLEKWFTTEFWDFLGNVGGI